jgi:hypothetical protein
MVGSERWKASPARRNDLIKRRQEARFDQDRFVLLIAYDPFDDEHGFRFAPLARHRR